MTQPKEELKDRELGCKECNQVFIFTVGEQKFYLAQAYDEPKRCKACRTKKKRERQKNRKRFKKSMDKAKTVDATEE